MKRLLSMLVVLCCVFPALGAYRFNPISTNTPAGMTNVILDVAARGTNAWSTNSVSAIRATGSAYATNFVGQLSPTNYNNGTGAAVTTFLRGDGTWVNPSTGSATNAIGNLDGLGTNTTIYDGLTSVNATTNKGTVYFPNALTAGDGKIMVIDQVTKSVKTAQNAGVTNGQFWGSFNGDGSLVTGLTNGLATVPYVTAATNAMNGANWTFGNLAGNGLGLTHLRTNSTADDGVLPAAASYPFSGWFTDNNGVPLWREFYYITNSFPSTLFFNITGNAGTATTATNAMLLSSTGIGLADTNWVLSQVASLGSYMYFGGPTNTFAITNSGETVSRTNVFTGSTAPFPTASTNSVTGLTLNAYVRHVISTNRFNVIEAGPVSIVTYPFRAGGAGTVSGHYEFYVVDCVSNIMYEIAAGPVTVISATVPTAIQTSLSLTNAFIATNQCYFAIAFKMDSVGSGGPTLNWANGGSYDAHVTFTRPLSSATINASQIVGVIATNNVAGAPVADYYVKNVSGVPTWESAAAGGSAYVTQDPLTNHVYGTNVMGRVTNTMQVLNVMDYGATTNGVDCAAAFQAAIDASTNYPSGKKVFVPAGQYTIASTLNLWGGQTLEGENAPLSTGSRLIHTGSGACILVGRDDVTSGSFAIRNLHIAGNDNSFGVLTKGYGSAYAQDYYVIDNVRVYGAKVGLFMSKAWNGEIISPYMQSCTYGIIASNSFNAISIIGGHIGPCTTGIYFTGGTASDVINITTTIETCQDGIVSDAISTDNLNIMGCYFEGITNTCVTVSNGIAMKITGNWMYSHGTNIFLHGTVARPMIYGNYLYTYSDADANCPQFFCTSGTSKLTWLNNPYSGRKSANIFGCTTMLTYDDNSNLEVKGGALTVAGITNTALTSAKVIGTDANGKLTTATDGTGLTSLLVGAITNALGSAPILTNSVTQLAAGATIGAADGSALTNLSTTIATNSASDGHVLSATGDKLKWIAAPAGSGGGGTNAATVVLSIAESAVATDMTTPVGCITNGIRKFRITATEAFTLSNPAGIDSSNDGVQATWEVIQDGTGGWAITMGNKFAFGTDITGITLSTTANKRDFITAIYNATADKWYVVGFVRGY